MSSQEVNQLTRRIAGTAWHALRELEQDLGNARAARDRFYDLFDGGEEALLVLGALACGFMAPAEALAYIDNLQGTGDSGRRGEHRAEVWDALFGVLDFLYQARGLLAENEYLRRRIADLSDLAREADSGARP